MLEVRRTLTLEKCVLCHANSLIFSRRTTAEPRQFFPPKVSVVCPTFLVRQCRPVPACCQRVDVTVLLIYIRFPHMRPLSVTVPGSYGVRKAPSSSIAVSAASATKIASRRKKYFINGWKLIIFANLTAKGWDLAELAFWRLWRAITPWHWRGSLQLYGG